MVFSVSKFPLGFKANRIPRQTQQDCAKPALLNTVIMSGMELSTIAKTTVFLISYRCTKNVILQEIARKK
jgi:hypothetical protein